MSVSFPMTPRDIKHRVSDIGKLPWLKCDPSSRKNLNPYMVSGIIYVENRMILSLVSLYVAYQSSIGPSYSEPLNKGFVEKNVKVGGVVSFYYSNPSLVMEYRDATPESIPISDNYRLCENPLNHCHTDPNVKICLGHHADILHEKMTGKDEYKFTYTTTAIDYCLHDKHDKYRYRDDIHQWEKFTTLNNIYSGGVYAYSGIGEKKRCKYCENPPVLSHSKSFLEIFKNRYPQYMTRFYETSIIVTRDPSHESYVEYGVKMVYSDKFV